VLALGASTCGAASNLTLLSWRSIAPTTEKSPTSTTRINTATMTPSTPAEPLAG
jgi:hypothetical protein